jgi:hypothetical protein
MHHDLPEAALAELRRIEAVGVCETFENPAFEVLWQRRYIMGSHRKTHIAAQGRRLVQILDGKVPTA